MLYHPPHPRCPAGPIYHCLRPPCQPADNSRRTAVRMHNSAFVAWDWDNLSALYDAHVPPSTAPTTAVATHNVRNFDDAGIEVVYPWAAT